MGGIISGIVGVFGGLFGGGGPQQVEVEVKVDFWERNKTLFILIFLMVAALIVSRL